MKIIHVEDYFLPHTGYQINIVPKYQSIQGHDVTIITSKVEGIQKLSSNFFGVSDIEKEDNKYELNTGVKIIRVAPFTKKLISSRIVQGRKFFKIIDSLNPDIVLCHGNDTLTGIRMALRVKKSKYPIVFDSHMLDMASKNKFNKFFYKVYKLFITPIILKKNIPVIRTQDDHFVENRLGIPLKQCPWISYGSDTLIFKPNKEVRQKFRTIHNISEEDFIVIYAGKLDEAKGGKLLAKAFEKKFDTKRNIVLVVVGSTVGDYGNEVEEIFRKSENRILRFPTQKYVDLPQFYQAADLSVFPKQCSLSFYDVQSCGLPVLSEDNNINVDRLKHNNGYTFKSDDISDFRNKIIYCANMNKEEYDLISKNSYEFIIQNYNYEDMANQYTDILVKERNKFIISR